MSPASSEHCQAAETYEMDLVSFDPGNTLIRAAFSALSIVMFQTAMSETMSVVPAYCPNDPMDVPCVPLQYMDQT